MSSSPLSRVGRFHRDCLMNDGRVVLVCGSHRRGTQNELFDQFFFILPCYLVEKRLRSATMCAPNPVEKSEVALLVLLLQGGSSASAGIFISAQSIPMIGCDRHLHARQCWVAAFTRTCKIIDISPASHRLKIRQSASMYIFAHKRCIQCFKYSTSY